MPPPPRADYYALLGVAHDATPDEVKRAYRHTLLRQHPDKSRSQHNNSNPNLNSNPNRLDAALLKQAYETLMSSDLRAEYDVLLAHARLQYFDDDDGLGEEDDAARRRGNRAFQRTHLQSRPAHIVSLDDFEEANDIEEAWVYPCRCGGFFRITEAQMEEDFHLVCCPGCSEVIWVGYEVVDDEDDPDVEEEVEEDENEETAGPTHHMGLLMMTEISVP